MLRSRNLVPNIIDPRLFQKVGDLSNIVAVAKTVVALPKW